MKKKSHYNVAVVGVGAVGVEMLRVLRQRRFPLQDLRVLARSRREIEVDGHGYQVESVTPDSFDGIDIALFAGTEGEKGAAVTYAPEAVKRGAVVIDNGADFRMRADVPLVVPEVNPEALKQHRGIVANPNCSTIQMLVAIAPLHRAAGLKRVIVSTFQAASGAGRSAAQQLWDESAQIRDSLSMDQAAHKPRQCRNTGEGSAFQNQIAFNLFPQIGGYADYGFTSEEWKMTHETHKILNSKKIKVSATCVRVPVLNGHAESVYVETVAPLSGAQVRSLLRKSPGLTVIDSEKAPDYPMPAEVSGTDGVYVGRIRTDPHNKNGIWLWVVADNLRKGAATNAVQIAETLIGKKK